MIWTMVACLCSFFAGMAVMLIGILLIPDPEPKLPPIPWTRGPHSLGLIYSADPVLN